MDQEGEVRITYILKYTSYCGFSSQAYLTHGWKSRAQSE